MKPSIADTARAYLLPAVATVCAAQVVMLLAMLLLETPESVFQGPTFRYGVALAMVVSIISLRRRAGRAFDAAQRNGDVTLRTMPMMREARSSDRQALPLTPVAGARPSDCLDDAFSTTSRGPRTYVSVAASCPERTLVVLYLQFRRLPYAIEPRKRGYAAAAGHHA